MAFAAAQFAFLLADFDGESVLFPNLAILSFVFDKCKSKITHFNKGLFLFSNQSCFCAEFSMDGLYYLLNYDIFIVIDSIFKLKID